MHAGQYSDFLCVQILPVRGHLNFDFSRFTLFALNAKSRELYDAIGPITTYFVHAKINKLAKFALIQLTQILQNMTQLQ